ncbi:metallophosphoesterase [Mumia sp. ZJ430]|uniref:metallophosphoesterase n=1 Tax=Mumia sp. ZJ430 TaxID=2708083 RepID=UPI0014207BBB|nr:metallophosphoesterase [Mumia sp. ZJ430]
MRSHTIGKHRLPRTPRPWIAAAAGLAVVAAGIAVAGPASAARPQPLSPPLLTPADGSFLEGTATFAATPVTAGDSVTSLTVDGTPVIAETTLGVSHLVYDVGTNSMDAAFGNHVEVNGHRIDPLRTAVSERVSLEVPNEFLVAGDNTVVFQAGGRDADCGVNFDDFTISDVDLELLGETADGEKNEYTYAMGDGSCGSNPGLTKTATLTFTVDGDPRRTTGLSAEVDTTTLANGRHKIVATTRSRARTTNAVRVNNTPVGAPSLTPTDGTLANGRQPVIASQPAASDGGVGSITVDGKAPPTRTTLGTGASTFSFDVGSNAIEFRYQNSLRVNGHTVSLGGDHASTRVDLAVPNRYLVPGRNTLTVVTGDIGSTCGANRDDFDIANLALTPSEGTATPVDVAASYSLGDGNCGSSTKPREVELRFDVEATGVSTYQTLGSGDAVLAFDVGSNAMDAAAGNYLLVNGMRQEVENYAGERARITVPNDWLLPGHNVVEIVTGTYAGECPNRDDFVLSNVELVPADGSAAPIGLKPTYGMGDGGCGSNVTSFTEVDLHFEVDAAARGRRADVQTADLADGEHQVVAASTTGEKATRTLVTDNTAPAVASSAPAAGETITAATVLAVEVEDASGVSDGPVLTLDGEPIEQGAVVGPGLSAGEHTLAVTATDALGNTAARSVVFRSAGIPDEPTDLAPASGSRDVARTATLSATVAEPDGGPVRATFSEAEILEPHRGWQGTADAVPTTLQVAGEDGVRDLRTLAPGDDRTLAAPRGSGVTFQRFDIAVRGRVEAPVLRWEGTIDPERVASLRVWNRDTRAWDVVASSPGSVGAATVLDATIDADYVDRGKVHAMVTGEDPFADDLESTVDTSFADPAGYDFAIAHYTDTQYLSEGAVEQETAAERAVWATAYTRLTEWIAENADDRKIAYVAHTGDITENNINAPTTDEMRQQITGEFETSSGAQGILDAAGVPNGVVAGNHDNQRGLEIGPESTFNQYYGPGRYASAAASWEHASYGGPWREGDNQNHYDLFSAGGLDFVVVGLSFGVTKEEADWAESVFKAYPDRNGILLTHDYLTPSVRADGRDSELATPDGSTLFNTVVLDNPNVFLVLAGHRHGVGTNVKPKVGDVGHGVVELLADYQAYTVDADRLGLTEIGGYLPTDRLRFGASFLRMLQFDVERSQMVVDTYSPFLDDFGANDFDPDARYDGSEDDTVLPVDLSSRATTFSTDALALYVPSDVIASTTVDSGEVASVQWTRLRPDTVHTWFVTARSSGGGETSSLPSVFVTKDADGRPGHFGPDHPAWPYFAGKRGE